MIKKRLNSLGDVVETAEGEFANTPLMLIWTCDNACHIVPVECFRKIINGELEIDAVDDWRDIFKIVLKEWLNDRVQSTRMG